VQLFENFTAFYGNRRFITVFTRALHWSLSRARQIESIPLHSNYPPIYALAFLVVSFLLAVPPISYMHSYSPPFVQHPPLLHNSSHFWRRVRVMKLLIMHFSPTSCHFTHASIRIFSSAPCSQSPSVYIPPLMSETKFHTRREPQAKLKFCIF
jgi:hypothetical protein